MSSLPSYSHLHALTSPCPRSLHALMFPCPHGASCLLEPKLRNGEPPSHHLLCHTETPLNNKTPFRSSQAWPRCRHAVRPSALCGATWGLLRLVRSHPPGSELQDWNGERQMPRHANQLQERAEGVEAALHLCSSAPRESVQSGLLTPNPGSPSEDGAERQAAPCLFRGPQRLSVQIFCVQAPVEIYMTTKPLLSLLHETILAPVWITRRVVPTCRRSK